MSDRADHSAPNPNPQSLADIVGEALELPAPQRPAFLLTACGTDAALLARAKALVASHDRAARAGFLAQPTGSPEAFNSPSAAELAREGTRIGPYSIGRCVGAGGFGVVFEATQEEPIKRRVAIKLLRAGMATPQIVARFDTERRALAMMEHPGIAKVLDAGATSDNTPYFVMEFVDGEPLVAFCDRHRLSLHDRIHLTIQICRALQHAHVKGLIHRDVTLSTASGHHQMHIGNKAACPGMVNGKPGGIGAKPLPGFHLALITLFRDLRIKAEGGQRMHRKGREAC